MSERPTAEKDAPRMATVRYRSPGGRWLTVTGEVVEPMCICDQITSRLFSCPVHPTRVIPPGKTEEAP